MNVVLDHTRQSVYAQTSRIQKNRSSYATDRRKKSLITNLSLPGPHG